VSITIEGDTADLFANVADKIKEWNAKIGK
jgi:hypothetical protein